MHLTLSESLQAAFKSGRNHISVTFPLRNAALRHPIDLSLTPVVTFRQIVIARNAFIFIGPLAKIDQLATLAAERAVGTGLTPYHVIATGWAFYYGRHNGSLPLATSEWILCQLFSNRPIQRPNVPAPHHAHCLTAGSE
ncbi:hypothetical protein SSYM_2395 [Serratia symbiotica str. Tucson]|uniref:Uncharacterized protein n=1 Tax=Serratia symbiotica str. Tucson TaxID=914128 RepID=E9CPE8_9GAMM|nr:hypothetical protein SSYM_2395 [Serratia symbiotica str. Tucson]